jgi:hypothetical protein
LKKEHAERNEALNDELIASGKYNDWVVTTAFYSAIHYVEYKLFKTPFTFLSVSVKSLDMAHSVIESKDRRSRHETRGKLVNLKLLSISVQYDFLRKNSQNARYIDYNVPQEQAVQAKRCLNKIKEVCIN